MKVVQHIIINGDMMHFKQIKIISMDVIFHIKMTKYKVLKSDGLRRKAIPQL